MIPLLNRCYPIVKIGLIKKEAGGVLMGKLYKDSADIIIDKLTLPSQKDTRSRFRFLRHFFSHQKRIDEEWEKSNKTCTYLGEWHTHPEDYPTPLIRRL